MTESMLFSNRIRSKSALPKNFTNIELHAHLDDAKGYQDKVELHIARSRYQNHVLQSAERFYEKQCQLRPSSSLSSFNRRSKMTSSTKLNAVSSAFFNLEGNNPESKVMNGLQMKTLRINDIKNSFDYGKEEKQFLKKRMEQLKQKIVEEKNKKAKISLRNCKLMNSAEISNYSIDKLEEQSRRNSILINELMDQINTLQNDNSVLESQNMKTRELIEQEKCSVSNYSEFVGGTRLKLDREKKLLEVWKQRATVSYKSMTNEYMNLNQLKEEKALLLNHIDIDFQNSL